MQWTEGTIEDKAILEALRVEREAKEREAADTARSYVTQLGHMATQETVESQFAQAVIDYQAEREQLPQPGDSKKVLREKRLHRMSWAMEVGNTRQGAGRYSGIGLDEFGLLILHGGDQIRDPELLFSPEPDAHTMLRQGWVVGYEGEISWRKHASMNWQIDLENRCETLEAGFAVQNYNQDKILSYESLYKITASQYHNEPAKLLEVSRKGEKIEGEDLLFPFGLVLEATRQIKRNSPYPDILTSLRRSERREEIIYAPEILLAAIKEKLKTRRLKSLKES